MNFIELFNDHHIATIYDWLQKDGSLVVHFEFPHNGGSGFTYSISALKELRELIYTTRDREEIEIFVFNRSEIDDDEEKHEINELTDLEWVYKNFRDVIYLAVKKNCIYNQRFVNEPDRYRDAVNSWNLFNK
jgi:hypothetical protein